MGRKIWDLKVATLMAKDKDEQMDFPVFLRSLRQLLGLTRRAVCEDIGIGEPRLLDLEYGHFVRYPGNPLIKKIADYYEVPEILLRAKAHEWNYQCRKHAKRLTSYEIKKRMADEISSI